MFNNEDRLELTAAIVDLIDQHRRRTGNPDAGSDIERFLLEREWQSLEQDILRNPGALEPHLVRVRPRSS